MKSKNFESLSMAAKAVATWDYEIGVLEEVRKQLMRLTNIERANMRQVNKFHAINNFNYPEKDIERICKTISDERNLLFELMQGLSHIMSDNNRLPGIIAHGKQLSLFAPVFVEIGEEPAATHKGGSANAK